MLFQVANVSQQSIDFRLARVYKLLIKGDYASAKAYINATISIFNRVGEMGSEHWTIPTTSTQTVPSIIRMKTIVDNVVRTLFMCLVESAMGRYSNSHNLIRDLHFSMI